MAISGSGVSKWLDLSGTWLDLGGIHPGWFVRAIWTHRNCPRDLQGGQKWPKNAIKRAFMALSGSGGSKWLDLSGYWLDLGGIHPGWSVGAIWTHWNCPQVLHGGQKWPKNAIKQAFLAIGCSGGSKWLDLSVWEALRRESTVWFIFGAL